MVRGLLPLVLFFASSVFAQNSLSSHVSLIKEIMPNSTRVAILFKAGDSAVEAAIQKTSTDNGLMVVRVPVNSIREIAPAMRNLQSFDVDFVYLVEDRIVTGTNSIKFVVKQTVKKGIPVFTSAENAFKGGACGQLVGEGGGLLLKINGKVSSRFELKIPEGSGKIKIEE